MLLHTPVTTCFSLSCSVFFFFFFFFWFATAPIGSWTVETAARHNGNVLQDLSRCKLSAWTQLSSDIEHVKSWPELYNVSHEPLLWHPTTRQMAFTPPTTQKHAVLQDQNRRMVLPSAAVKSRSLFLTWRPIGVFLFNCLGSCLFSQATTASPGFFFSFFLSFSFFFFTWESQTTSGPMLGYRPNNCTTELLIQWLSNASMRVSFGHRWQHEVTFIPMRGAHGLHRRAQADVCGCLFGEIPDNTRIDRLDGIKIWMGNSDTVLWSGPLPEMHVENGVGGLFYIFLLSIWLLRLNVNLYYIIIT